MIRPPTAPSTPGNHLPTDNILVKSGNFFAENKDTIISIVVIAVLAHAFVQGRAAYQRIKEFELYDGSVPTGAQRATEGLRAFGRTFLVGYAIEKGIDIYKSRQGNGLGEANQSTEGDESLGENEGTELRKIGELWVSAE